MAAYTLDIPSLIQFQGDRPIFDLKNLPETSDPSERKGLIKTVLEHFHIATDALTATYNLLGKGDLKVGEELFEQERQKRHITIERVGHTKDLTEKFYLMLNPNRREIRNMLKNAQKENKSHTHAIHSAISKKGKTRSTKRCLDHLCNLDHAIKLSAAIKSSPNKKTSHISRIMNSEDGIAVSQAGGENLYQLLCAQDLTKPARFTIYQSLLEGIIELHSLGYTHGDLKLQNVVVIRDEERAIIGVKIIDLEGLAREGERMSIGTSQMHSPERLTGTHLDFNDKDDVWAAMLMICQIESCMPTNERLIGDQILAEFAHYQKLPLNARPLFFKRLLMPFLFSLSAERPLDNLVYKMAAFRAEERSSAEKALKRLKDAQNLSAFADFGVESSDETSSSEYSSSYDSSSEEEEETSGIRFSSSSSVVEVVA